MQGDNPSCLIGKFYDGKSFNSNFSCTKCRLSTFQKREKNKIFCNKFKNLVPIDGKNYCFEG